MALNPEELLNQVVSGLARVEGGLTDLRQRQTTMRAADRAR
jgi:hypothetical protein